MRLFPGQPSSLIDFGQTPSGLPTIFVAAAYLFLEDHIVGGLYIQAGTTLSADPKLGGLLPSNWFPTPNVDPLTRPAVDAFYAAGPRDLGLVRQQWSFVNVPPPVTYWKQVSPNLYALTGLGSDQTKYPPKFAIIPHPVTNYPG